MAASSKAVNNRDKNFTRALPPFLQPSEE